MRYEPQQPSLFAYARALIAARRSLGEPHPAIALGLLAALCVAGIVAVAAIA